MQITNQKEQLIASPATFHFKLTFYCFFVQLNKLETKFRLLFIYPFFHYRLDPDPKQIIQDPDPGSSVSNRIRICNIKKNISLKFSLERFE